MKAAGRPPAAELSRQWLTAVVAARCRGATLVVGDDAGLAAALGGEAAHLPAPPGEVPAWTAEGVDTVVLDRVLHRLEDKAGQRLVESVWDRLAPGGRLMVLVPNERLGGDPHQVRSFHRRKLKRLLRDLGHPHLVKDQPYRWLLMCVDKPRADGAPLIPTKRERYRVTIDLCRGRVLELGCCDGELTRAIHEAGHEIVGLDLSADKIRRARARHPGPRFVVGDAAETVVDGGPFDTVLLAEILEHVDDAVGTRIIDGAWRAVAPGGRLIVSVPNESCIPHPLHLREFDRRGLRALLEPLGRPRLVQEIPFKWLMMYVDRPRGGEPEGRR